MKIFISWSGELSGNVAKNLKNSLSGLIQQAEFFLSSIDIAKGESWDQTLIKELSTCNYGIVCLTKENVSAPWINFEAGALAKQLDSKIYVLMVDVQASDINGPLSRFQATRLEKDDFRVMVDSICKEIDDPSLKEKVEGIYEFVWQGFEEKVRQYILESSHPDATENSDIPERLVIEEILRITRQISVSVESMSNQHLHFIERAYPLFCEKSLGAQRPLKIDSVCSVDELAKSIISQHVITLKKGNYCTTDITYQNEHVFHEDVFDGKQLVIDEINNLILLGNGATLTTRPRYAQVLCFNRCNNIIIDDFIMGHTKEPGTCLGNVIEFRDCSNVYLNNLKLYGCGTYGIELIDCRNIYIDNVDIYKCTYGALEYSNSECYMSNINIYDCNNTFELIVLRDSILVMVRSSIHDNKDVRSFISKSNSQFFYKDLVYQDNTFSVGGDNLAEGICLNSFLDQ